MQGIDKETTLTSPKKGGENAEEDVSQRRVEGKMRKAASVEYLKNQKKFSEHMKKVQSLVQDAFEKAHKDLEDRKEIDYDFNYLSDLSKMEDEQESVTVDHKVRISPLYLYPDQKNEEAEPRSHTSLYSYSVDLDAKEVKKKLQKYAKGAKSQSMYNFYSSSLMGVAGQSDADTKDVSFTQQITDRSWLSTENEADFVTEYDDYMKLMFEDLKPPKRLRSEYSLSDVSSSLLTCEPPHVERTMLLIKPEAITFKAAIFKTILDNGFHMLGVRVLRLTPEQAAEVYSKRYGTKDFANLVVSISVGPCLVVYLAGIDLINRLNKLIGPLGTLNESWFFPTSMRKMFGLHDRIDEVLVTAENPKAAKKQTRYFYPNQIPEPICQKLEEVWDYCDLHVNKLLAEGCAEVVKQRPKDPILFLADWLLERNIYQPRYPKKIAVIGT